MAEREEVFDVEVGPNTPIPTPVIEDVSFPPGIVVGIEIIIPPGPAGLAGIALSQAHQRVIPRTPGAFFVGDNQIIRRDLEGYLNTGDWQVEMYNHDAFAHTFEIRFQIREITSGVVTATSSTPIAITAGGEVNTSETPASGAPPTEESTPEAPGELGSLPKPTEEPSGTPPTEPVPPIGEEPTPPAPEAPAVEEPAPETAVPEAPAVEEPAPETAIPEQEPLTLVAEGAEPEPKFKPTPQPKPKHAAHKKPAHKVTKKHPARKHGAAKPSMWNVPRTLAGHPEVKHGVAIVVNVIMHRWPRLVVTSTTGGHHAANSLHYRGEAVDLAVPAGASDEMGYMHEAALWIAKELKSHLTEGIHNPGLSIHDGVDVSSSFWGEPTWGEHRNHIHIGVAGGQSGAAERSQASHPKPAPAHKHPAKKKPPAHQAKPKPKHAPRQKHAPKPKHAHTPKPPRQKHAPKPKHAHTPKRAPAHHSKHKRK